MKTSWIFNSWPRVLKVRRKMKTEMNFAMKIEIGTFLFSTRIVSVCDATKQF